MRVAKQEAELHEAILDYMQSKGFAQSVAAFQAESKATLDPKQNGLLEKKWTSLLRLQKKVCARARATATATATPAWRQCIAKKRT